MQKTVDWSLTAEDETRVKDDIENRTGIFHWRTRKGDYIPVNELTLVQVQYAIKVCERRVKEMFDSYDKKKKHDNYLHTQIKCWLYRQSCLMDHENELLGRKELV